MLDFPKWKIEPGIHWLKGGNGTGKSTLFEIIAGQIPFQGEVFLDDIILKKQPIEFLSHISFAEAEPQYPNFITGKEMIDFYSEVRKADPKQGQELADYFDMTDFLADEIGGYSSGMTKKLSLICAFIGYPTCYILDEPFITIDAASTKKLYTLISERAAEGKSFLLSSHQPVDDKELRLDGIYQIIDKQIVKL